MKLPQAKFLRYDVTDTTADGVMFVEVTKFAPYHTNPEMQTASTAFGPEIPSYLRVVHCVTEFNRETSGANQVMMGVVSGIYQKRVLGIPEQFTFGVFQFHSYFLQIVAGVWRDDEVG